MPAAIKIEPFARNLIRTTMIREKRCYTVKLVSARTIPVNIVQYAACM